MPDTADKIFGALKPVRIEGRDYEPGDPVDRGDHRPEAIRRLKAQEYLGYLDDAVQDFGPPSTDTTRAETGGRPDAMVPEGGADKSAGA